jgi:hypothetical protein
MTGEKIARRNRSKPKIAPMIQAKIGLQNRLAIPTVSRTSNNVTPISPHRARLVLEVAHVWPTRVEVPKYVIPRIIRNHPALLSFKTSMKPTMNDTAADNHSQTLWRFSRRPFIGNSLLFSETKIVLSLK